MGVVVAMADRHRDCDGDAVVRVRCERPAEEIQRRESVLLRLMLSSRLRLREDLRNWATCWLPLIDVGVLETACSACCKRQPDTVICQSIDGGFVSDQRRRLISL